MDISSQFLDKIPKKLLTVGSTALATYALDRQFLFSSDLRRYSLNAIGLLQSKYLLRQGFLVPDLFEEAVRKWPQSPCMRFEDRTLSFTEVDIAANHIANWGLKKSLQIGQTVALLMENRPEYVIVWIGLAKIGVVTALINTHLQADGLVHCIKISDAKILLLGEELLSIGSTIKQALPQVNIYVYGNGMDMWTPCADKYPFAESLDQAVAHVSGLQPNPKIRKEYVKTIDMALLIYTSGTTGLPKAAKVNHASIIFRSLNFKVVMGLNIFDRIYCALPLYHTSGGNLAVGMMIFSGAMLYISRRFSTSRFWHEVRQNECTVIQYIGEMCRYLLNTPPQIEDKKNKVRAAFGNGLRPDVWSTFQDRFGIGEVYEFYGSTEGVFGMMNPCTTMEDRGHLGKRGFLCNYVSGTHIIRFDVEKEEYIRDPKRGFMLPCQANEVGELIAAIKIGDPSKSFQGYYKNEQESNKKILRNVFKKGDIYFRTGDLFRFDDSNCWHFVDRIGDTFRWKGENVSTNEVGETISKFPGLSEICVYGVEVPGNEGRACMAAMVFDEQTFDVKTFAAHAMEKLPSYAVPIFLRRLSTMSVTGTMKHEKAKMRKEGMDPTKIQDHLWVLDRENKTYQRLTSENYHQTVTKARL